MVTATSGTFNVVRVQPNRARVLLIAVAVVLGAALGAAREYRLSYVELASALTIPLLVGVAAAVQGRSDQALRWAACAGAVVMLTQLVSRSLMSVVTIERSASYLVVGVIGAAVLAMVGCALARVGRLAAPPVSGAAYGAMAGLLAIDGFGIAVGAPTDDGFGWQHLAAVLPYLGVGGYAVLACAAAFLIAPVRRRVESSIVAQIAGTLTGVLIGAALALAIYAAKGALI